MKPLKRAAIIHDMCSVGKAAMTNILPVLSVMGIEACPIPTMLLSTHTGGYGRPVMYSTYTFISDCANHFLANGISFDYILVGYLGDSSVIDKVKKFISYFPDAFVLCDPIMGDHGHYYMNFDDAYNKKLQKLLPVSGLITPNYTESCFITGEPYAVYCDEQKLQNIYEKLAKMGISQAVITSVPMEDFPQSIAVCTGESIPLILKKASSGKAYHGTGDLFTAVLLGNLIQGSTLYESVAAAHEFVCGCIRLSDQYDYPEREGILLEPNLKYLIREV